MSDEKQMHTYPYPTPAAQEHNKARYAGQIIPAKHTGSSEFVRVFDSGATRNADSDRHDYEGFLSPLVIGRFGEYMHKHRVQADGSVRASDNWQRGMPLATYIKGLLRHAVHLWQRHRGWAVTDPKAAADIEEDLCAILFNAQGYLHNLLAAKQPNVDPVDPA